LEFVRHIHDYLNDYIRLADAKAGAIFLIASGMIGFLVPVQVDRITIMV
jgi:hypothetical protein